MFFHALLANDVSMYVWIQWCKRYIQCKIFPHNETFRKCKCKENVQVWVGFEGSCLISSVSSFISCQETGVTGAYVSHLSSSLPRPLFCLSSLQLFPPVMCPRHLLTKTNMRYYSQQTCWNGSVVVLIGVNLSPCVLSEAWTLLMYGKP